MDAAIAYGREALATDASQDDPLRLTLLSNLSQALRARYLHADDVADLHAAVEAAREALAAVGRDHGDHARYLINLCALLQLRAGRLGSMARSIRRWPSATR